MPTVFGGFGSGTLPSTEPPRISRKGDHVNNRREKKKAGGECCNQNADGTFSDYPLQEQMVEGVDDYDFRMQTRAKLLAAGVPIADLDKVLPEKPRT
jgi:hypothetical protein